MKNKILISIAAITLAYYIMKPNKKIVSPTRGKLTRNCDPFGCGYFGASRGNRPHIGIDFVASPGDEIYSPISGNVVRESLPYASDTAYRGLLIENEQYEVKIFYLRPVDGIIGKKVSAGQLVGTAQNISAKYGASMVNHVHVQIQDKATQKFIPITDLI